MKVKKVATFYDKYSNTVVYEYRGIQYDVEYPTCRSYCCTAPKVQHMDAQRKIDRMLERPQAAEAEQEETSKTFEEQLDEIFEMLGWND